MEASTPPAATADPPPATLPSPDAGAAEEAAAAEGSSAGEGGLVLDAAIYEPPAERLRNYQQVRGLNAFIHSLNRSMRLIVRLID